MSYNVLVLGASYGSLFATKLAMAGHDATLVCRRETADLINSEGTEVRIPLRGEELPRSVRSTELPGRITAKPPHAIDPTGYDLCVLAMQEPQFAGHSIWTLVAKIASAGIPCLSIMNMPPLAYLKRIPGLDATTLEGAYTTPRLWDQFEPGRMSLCSPDPQAFRLPGGPANVLEVGLATNFKAAAFQDPADTAMLRQIATDIDAVRLDGKEVPVKLRVHDSLMVPLAKWSMLMAGNYRCVNHGGARSIRDAVHEDLSIARSVYDFVGKIALALGADASELVPFDKYAAAADGLRKPSSVARALVGGSVAIERVDILIQAVAAQLGLRHSVVDSTVDLVNAVIEQNYYRTAWSAERSAA